MEAGRSHPDRFVCSLLAILLLFSKIDCVLKNSDAVRVVQLCAKQLAASTQAMVASSKQSPDALGSAATQAATTVARICNATAIISNPSGTSASNVPDQVRARVDIVPLLLRLLTRARFVVACIGSVHRAGAQNPRRRRRAARRRRQYAADRQ
jgi:hypothetical protein